MELGYKGTLQAKPIVKGIFYRSLVGSSQKPIASAKLQLYLANKVVSLIGISVKNLSPKGRSPLPKRAVTDTRDLSAFILSWNGEQDTEYGYVYKRRGIGNPNVTNRIGVLQQSTHPVFAVYK